MSVVVFLCVSSRQLVDLWLQLGGLVDDLSQGWFWLYGQTIAPSYYIFLYCYALVTLEALPVGPVKRIGLKRAAVRHYWEWAQSQSTNWKGRRDANRTNETIELFRIRNFAHLFQPQYLYLNWTGHPTGYYKGHEGAMTVRGKVEPLFPRRANKWHCPARGISPIYAIEADS